MTQLTLPQQRLSKKAMALVALLQRGGRYSKQEILAQLGIWNSGDIIMKIRRAGYNVKMEKVRKGDVEYGVYFLQNHERPDLIAEAKRGVVLSDAQLTPK